MVYIQKLKLLCMFHKNIKCHNYEKFREIPQKCTKTLLYRILHSHLWSHKYISIIDNENVVYTHNGIKFSFKKCGTMDYPKEYLLNKPTRI